MFMANTDSNSVIYLITDPIYHYQRKITMDDITMHNVTDVDNAIKTCFEAWVSAVATGNPDKVLALYADKAILLPTLL